MRYLIPKLLQGAFCLLIYISCQSESNNASVIGKINNAMDLLYCNDVEQAEAILLSLDFVNFRSKQKASGELAWSFLYLLKGETQLSINALTNASIYFDETNDDLKKAEIHLIRGFLQESTLMISEAANSYWHGFKYFSQMQNSDMYYKCLLGIIRTDPDGEALLKDAEKFVITYPSNKRTLLLLATKANLEEDRNKKLDLYKESLGYYDEDYSQVNLIRLYSNLAKTYQYLNQGDSAQYFMNLAESEINGADLNGHVLAHFLLIRSYIENRNGHPDHALSTLAEIINKSINKPGIIAHAYQMKSSINKSMGKVNEAFEDLKRYNEFLKLQFNENHGNQLALLRMQLMLRQKEIELVRTRKLWILSCLILMVMLIMGWLIHRAWRRNSRRKHFELEQSITVSNSKLKEQLEASFRNADSTVGQFLSTSIKGYKLQPKQIDGHRFKAYFNAEHPYFREKLLANHPHLSKTDLKYCDCFLADLDLSDVARVLGVSESAVKKARTKLKKLFGVDDNRDLSMYLRKIENKVL